MASAKIFKNGQSQAVRLPKEYRFQGNEIFINKIGNMVILMEKNDRAKILREAAMNFDEDFLLNRDQEHHQDRDSF